MLINTLLSLLRGYHVDLGTVAAQVISILFVILCILPLHELAHAWVANKLGDPTAKLEGRLTFNPLASVDPMGALALLLFGFGWAKPVPVDSRYFRKPKRDMAITALAGPVSNLLAAFVGAVLVAIMEAFSPYNGFTNFVYNVLWYYVVVNISLAVFNLIPMPRFSQRPCNVHLLPVSELVCHGDVPAASFRCSFRPPGHSPDLFCQHHLQPGPRPFPAVWAAVSYGEAGIPSARL